MSGFRSYDILAFTHILGLAPDFHNWFENFVNYVVLKTSSRPPEWTHIPQQALDELNSTLHHWAEAYSLCLKPHSEVETRKKNEVRKDAEALIRLFRHRYLDYHPDVSPADLLSMRMPVREKKRATGFIPNTFPEIQVGISVIRHLSFNFRDFGSKSRGKPRGVHGMEMLWAILDKPPESIAELVNSAFSTSSPLVLEFKENERGKRVYYCGRWESNANRKGPWGNIESAVIP